ncbi:MAG TPA: HAMP domain-containing histidine kinase [Firmicutes bacterium]|nr:HAMP domain-containing histidine kinase [Bacillota bacterium]
MKTLKHILFFRFVLPAMAGIILLYAAMMLFLNIRYKTNVLERFKQELPTVSRMIFSRLEGGRGRMLRPPETWRRNVGVIVKDEKGVVLMRYPQRLNPEKMRRINETPFQDKSTGLTADYYIIDPNFLTPVERNFIRQLWIFATGVLVLLGFLYLLTVVRFSKRMFRQSRDNAREIDRLARGQYDLDLKIPYAELSPFKEGLDRMAAELKEQEEVKRSFIINLSHDMKTPLTIIKGILEGLEDGVLSLDNNRFKEMLEEVALMEEYIGRIKAFDQMRKECRGETVVLPLISVFQKRFKALMEIHVEIPEGFTLPLGEAGLTTVFDNLLSNAYRYNSKREKLCVIRGKQDEGGLMLSVEDNGDGIRTEDTEKIFDAFYRSDKTRRSGEGTGMGLFLAREAVLAAGGTLHAEPKKEGGTKMIIYFSRRSV